MNSCRFSKHIFLLPTDNLSVSSDSINSQLLERNQKAKRLRFTNRNLNDNETALERQTPIRPPPVETVDEIRNFDDTAKDEVTIEALIDESKSRFSVLSVFRPASSPVIGVSLYVDSVCQRNR